MPRIKQFSPQSLFMASRSDDFRVVVSKRELIKFAIRGVLTGSIPVRVNSFGVNYEVSIPVGPTSNLVEIHWGLDFAHAGEDMHDFLNDLNAREET